MGMNSQIEWTQSTWNPVTGCTKTSEGCANCYAERMAKRLHAMGQANYTNGFDVTMHPHVLEHPLKWKKPQSVFVNSMSDLFHEDVTLEFIQQVFDVMRRADWHLFQILTKRSQRLADLAPLLNWPDNVWMGVTVESAACAGRIDDLRGVSASTRFLSLEPLLEPLPNLDLEGIDWVIVGGESGPGARPMAEAWVTDLRDQCRQARVPSSSSNGAARTRKRPVGYWTVKRGTRCQSTRTAPRTEIIPLACQWISLVGKGIEKAQATFANHNGLE